MFIRRLTRNIVHSTRHYPILPSSSSIPVPPEKKVKGLKGTELNLNWKRMSERGCHYGYFAPTWTRDYAWYMEYKTKTTSQSCCFFCTWNSWKLAEKIAIVRKALAKIAHTTIWSHMLIWHLTTYALQNFVHTNTDPANSTNLTTPLGLNLLAIPPRPLKRFCSSGSSRKKCCLSCCLFFSCLCPNWVKVLPTWGMHLQARWWVRTKTQMHTWDRPRLQSVHWRAPVHLPPLIVQASTCQTTADDVVESSYSETSTVL